MGDDEYRMAITSPRKSDSTEPLTAGAPPPGNSSKPPSTRSSSDAPPKFRVDDDRHSFNSIRTSLTSDSDDDNEIQAEFAEDWEGTHRESRETWSGQLDFILSCIGYAVGLGNVWRFPYLCYSNGGGAFLIPYFTFLILCGMPLTMLEMSMGQFASLGPTALFKTFCPMFQGLGWAQVLISGVCCVYYNIIIAWTVYYLYLSFAAQLPWTSCGHWWNTDQCVAGIQSLTNANTSAIHNITNPHTASEEFWVRYVLRLSPGIDQLGSIRWELAFCLLISWVGIFACLFKGVKSSGRVVYVTATFPYVVLVILCIRGITLPGALDGVYFYLVPEWEKLLDIKVWIAAASQIFYSVGAAWGVMITFSSFNKFHHNCYRDAIVIPLINCGTSIFAGIVVFSIIGFMAHESGIPVKEVIQSGPGLAFIVYPEAVANLPISPMWSILFFLMLLTIGVDSQFGMFETLVTAIVDTYPQTLRAHKPAFTGFVCFIMFILGLPCVTEGGMYVLQLMDWYSATFALMIVATCEMLLVSYNYGWRRYLADMQLMTRHEPSKWWPLCWMVISPTIVIVLLVASIVLHVPVRYNDYVYPDWAIAAGWTLALLAILPIPVYAVVNMCRAKGTFKERFSECMRPTPDWGPSRLGDRVHFRKSMNRIAGKQLYVKGVERQECEMVNLVNTHPSAANLIGYMERVQKKKLTGNNSHPLEIIDERPIDT